MADKITSIAELKKRVDFWANKDKNVMPSEKASLQWVLVLINEFEANVKRRIKTLKKCQKGLDSDLAGKVFKFEKNLEGTDIDERIIGATKELGRFLGEVKQ